MRLGIAILLGGVSSLTVPWFFVGRSEWELAGWPSWAMYSLLMNLLLAVFTAIALKRCWKRFIGSNDSD